ncbi:MAG TPA: GGDEF domain-containing protein [Acidobacteriaceae bacterium]|nr:GGDEF domain-containing protein [Acidobacteriaceae bacterium]
MRRSAVLALLLPFLPSTRAATPTPLPVLRTARQVHTLSFSDAARGFPVHLARAQVTYQEPSIGVLFLIDSTDGIFANLRPGDHPALHAGDIVAVDGRSGPGDVAPTINDAHFRILGYAPLPAAPLVSFDRLSGGAFDSRWITVEGIVRSIQHPTQRTDYDGHTYFDSSNLVLTLASGDQSLDVITRLPSGPIPPNLVDSRVRLRVAVGSRFNQRNQFIGVHLYTPDFSFVQVAQPAPRDPFALPLTSVTGVARIGDREPGHRVHLRGVVTSAFGDQHFSVMGSQHGIFITTQDPSPVRPGDLLDIVGFPSLGDYTSYLDGAVVRRLGSAPAPPPVPVTAAQALTGAWDAELIQLDGVLVDRSRVQNGINSLFLNDTGTSFVAALAPGEDTAPLNAVPLGSRLRLRGICVIHADDQKRPQALSLLLRSPADITVLATPPWWTPRHTLLLAAALGVLVLIISTRNLGLRRRVIIQTCQIQAQLEEARILHARAEAATHEKSQTLASLLTTQHDLLLAQERLRYQATHDALTGLLNRAALLDSLRREIERSRRTGASLGILLLDIDHFKTVNDTHGHLAGDAVLSEIGRRIARSTRAYDIAGRYGGEEFLVLLPGCHQAQTEHSAERIRAAIGLLPFHAGDVLLSLTVSIGATVALDTPGPDRQALDAEFLSCADLALYEAKSAGRDRTVLRLPDPVSV